MSQHPPRAEGAAHSTGPIAVESGGDEQAAHRLAGNDNRQRIGWFIDKLVRHSPFQRLSHERLLF
ncbi:hypothetical protein DVK00_13760 [Haloarcula sp. Atlit-47R]|nr:hypothetical protein DVK00_13760 [Haloarcula sp. Atlit-47R]